MATDVILSSGEVSNQSDMNANRTDPESDTPNRTSESPENRNISSATSLSTSSVRTGEDEPHEDSGTGISVANGNRAGDPQQETENTAETPDNRQKQGVRTSTPVRLPHTSAGQHNGSFEHQESVATTEARLRMEGVELKEEWQDEDFPRPLPEEEDIHLDEELYTGEGAPASQSYGLHSGKKTKRKLLAPDISLNLDHSEGSVLSDELDESTELDLDDIDTPSDNSNEFEWEGLFLASGRGPVFVMIFQSPKVQICCVRVWSLCRSTARQRSARRAGAGESSASEIRSTGWT
nr:BCL2/adenovirus E1B 19 kDa protein-interacting protein 2 isoform X3 [Danio rerio]|eukprot:XP_021326143.1 BCL2/adenovirus E1B 19 kDa protein-interacting protein 2 isoform X3 [Danio rerio]